MFSKYNAREAIVKDPHELSLFPIMICQWAGLFSHWFGIGQDVDDDGQLVNNAAEPGGTQWSPGAAWHTRHNSGLRVGDCGNTELPIVEIQNRQLWKSKLQNPIVKTCRPCDGQKGRARALNENDWHLLLLLLLILLAHVGHYDDQVVVVIIQDRSLWHLCQRAGASHHQEGFTNLECFPILSLVN